jgi:riboflavin synthase
MFTGIITHTGKVHTIVKDEKGLNLEIKLNPPKKIKIGSSLAIDGACFTAIKLNKNMVQVHAMPETLEKTIVTNYKPGETVNIEFPLTLNTPLDGHFVLGHIDAVGKVKKILSSKNKFSIQISYPNNLKPYFPSKGSVTLNGISLTISASKPESFQVDIIPHTHKVTNLKFLKPGSQVNIEIDALARYIIPLLK